MRTEIRLGIIIIFNACVLVTGADAQVDRGARSGEEIPLAADVRLLRKMELYDQAREFIGMILTGQEVPEAERRGAYNELVAMDYLTEGEAAARSTARKALTEYPDLQVDPVEYPPEIEALYAELRSTMFGRLYLTSNPGRCTVYLGERELGTTPLTGTYLPPGQHTLRVIREAFADEMIDVSISIGDSVSQNVTMLKYRDAYRPRLGVMIEVQRWKVDRPVASGSTSGTVSDWESTTGFGAGLLGYFPIRKRVAFQAGARYSRVGGKATYQWHPEIPDGVADVTYQYVTASVLFHHYPSRSVRFSLCYGFEIPYLLSADVTPAGNGEKVDIKDKLSPFQISVDLGAGIELPVGSHLLQFMVIYAVGMIGLDDSGEQVEEEVKPRELRFSAGFLL